MVGRGSRLSPGKKDCLILDFAGNIERHGAVDLIEIRTARRGAKDATVSSPHKTCPSCQSEIHAAKRECPDCGFIFTSDMQIKHDKVASASNVLSVDEVYTVKDFEAKRHQKSNSPDSLKITYYVNESNFLSFPVWVCLEHTGYALTRAKGWWLAHSGGEIPPETVTEALERIEELRQVKQIKVRKSGKFHEITEYEFMPDKPKDEIDLQIDQLNIF